MTTALAPDDPRHGTAVAYDYWACRCTPCRSAARMRRRAYPYSRPRSVLAADDPRHGTAGAYSYWRCRCEVCRAGERARYSPRRTPKELAAAQEDRLRRLEGSGRAANTQRATRAASRTATQAAAVLASTADLPDVWVTVLRARADNPDASLSQLGDALGMGKDAYAAMLRRALRGAMA